MTQRTLDDIWPGAPAETSSVRAFLGRAWEALEIWRQRSRQRAALRLIDERGLKDLGLSGADVWRECRKPFWRE